MCKLILCLFAFLPPAIAICQVGDDSITNINEVRLTIDVMPQRTAMITWKKDSSIRNGFFILERRVDTGCFTTMVSIKVSERLSEYRVTDEKPYQGINHYRIKWLQDDGSYSYSPAVAADLGTHIFYRFYPNPADDHLIVKSSKAVEMRVFSQSGVLMLQQPVDKGLTPIDLRSLSKGMYILMMINAETRSVVREILYKN